MIEFDRWYINSDIKGLIWKADKQLVEDWYSYTVTPSMDWDDIDFKFIKNSKLLPTKFNSIRNLLIAVLDMYGHRFMFESSFPDTSCIIVGEEKLSKSLVEPILDVLEDWPMWGVVEQKGTYNSSRFIIEPASFFMNNERWVIEPKDMS